MLHHFTHIYWYFYTTTNIGHWKEFRGCLKGSIFLMTLETYTAHADHFFLFKQALCLSVTGADHCCCGGLAVMHSEALQWTRQTILLWGCLSLQVSLCLCVCVCTKLSELACHMYLYFWACNIFLILVVFGFMLQFNRNQSYKYI